MSSTELGGIFSTKKACSRGVNHSWSFCGLFRKARRCSTFGSLQSVLNVVACRRRRPIDRQSEIKVRSGQSPGSAYAEDAFNNEMAPELASGGGYLKGSRCLCTNKLIRREPNFSANFPPNKSVPPSLSPLALSLSRFCVFMVAFEIKMRHGRSGDAVI